MSGYFRLPPEMAKYPCQKRGVSSFRCTGAQARVLGDQPTVWDFDLVHCLLVQAPMGVFVS